MNDFTENVPLKLYDSDEYEPLEMAQNDTKKSAFAETVISLAHESADRIKSAIMVAPAFLDILKTSKPEKLLVANLSDEQKKQLAAGALRLMRRKSDGSILATLVDDSTNKIYQQVPLKELDLSSKDMQAAANLSTQLQMAQIVEKIEEVQRAVVDVRKGLENDRLATAFSCEQKFLQITSMKNQSLKTDALLRFALDSEDSRNLLMLSLKSNVDFIKSQPESFLGKFISGANTNEITSRISEIRAGIYAINSVSMAQIVAYQMLGEPGSARFSMAYYANFVKTVFLDSEEFAVRLNQLDDSTEGHWTSLIPSIVSEVNELCNYECEKIALGA